MPLDAFFTASAEDDADIPWGLKIIALYRDLYEREFKFVARDSNRVALFEDDPAADAFIEAAFGAFPRTGFLAPLRDAYVQAFAPKNMPPTAASWRTVFDDRYRFPLSFTFTALRSDGTDLRMRFRTRARAEIVQQQMISNACRTDVQSLIGEAAALSEDDVTDKKFQLEDKKRRLAQHMFELTSTKRLDQAKADYQKTKSDVARLVKNRERSGAPYPN